MGIKRINLVLIILLCLVFFTGVAIFVKLDQSDSSNHLDKNNMDNEIILSQDAISACEKLSENDDCNFNVNEKVITGICMNTPEGIFRCVSVDKIDKMPPKDTNNISVVESDKDSNTNYNYMIVDTAVSVFYSDDSIISEPSKEDSFYGQDAQYQINNPSYTDNNDGTITDDITGLTWAKDMNDKISYDEAFLKAEESTLGGYDDWRVPTIKELYSLILFTGEVKGEKAVEFFIDTDYFNQILGDASLDEREIDAQTWSSTEYVGRTMKNSETVFGVNFVDGRIKGYPKYNPKTKDENKMYFRLVRGNENYGENNFVDNSDGTISDLATGLMWQQSDSSEGKNWEDSLSYAENLNLANYDDWRLPNTKELQSIVDYSRSPQTTNSAAIDSLFEVSTIIDTDGNINYPFFWTSTTHLDGANPESHAAYVCFGDAQGKMNDELMDVHGAGAQRSDPKSGSVSDYPEFFGPQGDVRYVYNYARVVRNI